jgi:hypothetical protein
LSYLTTGLKWKADYVALFDERAGKVDVQGWITLTNATGTTFNKAATLLVAGDTAPVQTRNRDGEDQPQGNEAGTESAAREQVGDFYIYPIAGRTTIANAQTKQVSFLDVGGAAASKSYEYRNGWLGTSDRARSASTILKFSSARAGGLGDALPAGTVRVYMRDSRGQAQFVGESPIPHTPMGSSLGLKTGEAFDVKVRPFVEKREKIAHDEWERSARFRVVENGRVRTTELQVQKEYWRTTFRYVLTNARPQPVIVDLIQGDLNSYWRDTRLVSESVPGRQINGDERLWQVAVPANGETVVTAVIETRD